jgi:drug/metabolite transporter (DMT)-like permease
VNILSHDKIESVKRNRPKGLFLGMGLTLSSAVIWGSAYPVIQLALKDYDSFTITVFRALLGAIVLSIYVLFSKSNVRPKQEDLPYLALASVLGATGFWTGLNFAVNYLESDTASFLAALYPLIAIVLASIAFHEKLKAASITGVLIGIFGTFVIVAFGEKANFTGSSPVLGTIIALSSAFSWAGYMVISRYLAGRKTSSGDGRSAEYVTFNTFLFAVPVAIILMLITSSGQYFFQSSASGIFYVGYLGIVASGIAFLLFNKGMKLIGITRAAINQLLFPAVTVFLTFFIFGAIVNWYELAGMVMIVCGILLAQLYR